MWILAEVAAGIAFILTLISGVKLEETTEYYFVLVIGGILVFVLVFGTTTMMGFHGNRD